MSKSNVTEIQEQDVGSIVQQFIYRLLKKNHEAMVELEVFYRDSTHPYECMAKCGNDENMKRLYKQFMDIITRDPVRSWGSSAALGCR